MLQAQLHCWRAESRLKLAVEERHLHVNIGDICRRLSISTDHLALAADDNVVTHDECAERLSFALSYKTEFGAATVPSGRPFLYKGQCWFVDRCF